MTPHSPQEIRQARIEKSQLRERDLAKQLGISELALLAAHCGEGALRLQPNISSIIKGLEPVGEVMALTRNESAVHEKIGVYDKIVAGDHSILALGEDIDLRIFPREWAHAFAVKKRDGDDISRSLQFFDASGDAVHKVHLRPSSDLGAYRRLVETHLSTDQSQSVATTTFPREIDNAATADQNALRDRWSKMTDVHQFFGVLKALKLSRLQAVRMVGLDYARELGTAAVQTMMQRAADGAMPIMCFVGNRGCIQIHSGPIHTVRPMGPWLNIMDENFHLHLRLDHVREAWAVRKPTKDGHVTSLEAYGADGEMIIQFFGKRHEGNRERADWRALVESLPAAERLTAA